MITLRKLSTAIATSAILLQVASPIAFAETNVVVSGNGAHSDNKVEVEKNNDTKVVQENKAEVSNNISGSASTGGNDANYNTGGDVAIKTGDAKSSVSVSNDLNANHADVDSCDCDGDLKINVSGNGAGSDNDVDFDQDSDVEVYQDNYARVYNNVDADASTGKNDANGNTGGDTLILTGNAKTDVDVSTKANTNIARVGGSAGHDNDVEAIISGNGAWSDNEIELDLDRDLTLVQDNAAKVYNDVDADATTGWNDANYNTGGDVAIKTGNAQANVDVDNMLNFNAADVDCGCLLGGKFAINGNGSYSESDIDADLDADTELFQDNYNKTSNDVDANAKTGKNDINDTTGEANSDPVIITGNAKQDVNVDNAGNLNVIGSGAEFHLPGVDVDFDVDFSAFWAWFGSHIHQS